MKQNITLKKIATMLNLSISTVSRALKNHPDISEATKQRIKELSETMEYEPNTYAINLKTNKSKEFCVIVPAISNYFYHSFIGALEEEVRNFGYSLIILQSGDDPAIEFENIKRCKQMRIAGLFISSIGNLDLLLKLDEENFPVIFFDKVPGYEACNRVCVADTEAAVIAAQTLVQYQKKQIISIFGPADLSITKRRLSAYQNFFKQHNEHCNIRIMHAPSPYHASLIVQEAFTALNKPDAIFCMSDEILTGVMKSVQYMHLKVPQDVGIIAISNGFIPQLYTPEITYVETSGFKLGKLSFSRMMSCMAGNSFKRELILDTILVNGGSL
jgi:LacI family transcriptional regulator